MMASLTFDQMGFRQMFSACLLQMGATGLYCLYIIFETTVVLSMQLLKMLPRLFLDRDPHCRLLPKASENMALCVTQLDNSIHKNQTYIWQLYLFQ